MAPRQVSDDLKAQIPALHREGYRVKDICHLLDIKKTLVYRVLKLYSQYGVVSNPHKYSCMIGRPRSLTHADQFFISAIIDHRRSVYLDELWDELWHKRHVHTTLSTLSCTIQQLPLSRKVISVHAYERSEVSRALYMNRIAEEAPDANMLVFVDEAAKNECTLSQKYGWSHKTVHCVVQRPFVRGLRYSIIPAITLDGIIAYDIVEGPVDGKRFLKFLKDHVVHISTKFAQYILTWASIDAFTNPYPGPHSVLVMDNCRIHHGQEICCFIEEEHRKL